MKGEELEGGEVKKKNRSIENRDGDTPQIQSPFDKHLNNFSSKFPDLEGT